MGKDNVWLAIALSLLALTLFDAMGLVIKLLSPRYSSAELTAWRNLFGLIPSLLALWFSSGWPCGTFVGISGCCGLGCQTITCLNCTHSVSCFN